METKHKTFSYKKKDNYKEIFKDKRKISIYQEIITEK